MKFSTLVILLRKDFTLELRNRETVTVLFSLSILLSLIIAVGVNGAFLNPSQLQRVFPALWWIASVFVATLAIGRSFEYESEHMAYEALLLSGVPAALLYASKVLVNFVVMAVGCLFTLFILAGLLDVRALPNAGTLILISIVVMFGYSALSTLLSALAAGSRLKTMLLPLLLLPLVFPLFFSALELSAHAFASGATRGAESWMMTAVGLDLIYFGLGLTLFDGVLRE